jgi:hypothetical protein
MHLPKSILGNEKNPLLGKNMKKNKKKKKTQKTQKNPLGWV